MPQSPDATPDWQSHPWDARQAQGPSVQQAGLASGVRTCQGQNYSFALPEGWNVSEGENVIALKSPDDSMAISRLREVMPGNYTPDAITEYIVRHAPGFSEVQFISAKSVESPSAGGRARLIEVSCRFQGVPTRGLVFCNVLPGNLCDMVTVRAPSESYSQVAGQLRDVAKSIQLTNSGRLGNYHSAIAAIDPAQAIRQNFAAQQATAQNIHDGFANQVAAQNNTSQMRADTTAGVSRWDPTGQVTAPGNATGVRPANGGYEFTTQPGGFRNSMQPYDYRQGQR